MEIQKAGQTSVRKFKVFLGQLSEFLIQFLTPLSPRDGCSEVVVSFGTDELPNGIQLLPICKGRREDGPCTERMSSSRAERSAFGSAPSL